jgi:hypothetical protein
MTDDERVSLLVSVMGSNHVVRERDARIPEGVPISAWRASRSARATPAACRGPAPARLMSERQPRRHQPRRPRGRHGDRAARRARAGRDLHSALTSESGAMIGRRGAQPQAQRYARRRHQTSRATHATRAWHPRPASERPRAPLTHARSGRTTEAPLGPTRCTGVHRHDAGRRRAPDRTALDGRRYGSEASVSHKPGRDSRQVSPRPDSVESRSEALRTHLCRSGVWVTRRHGFMRQPQAEGAIRCVPSGVLGVASKAEPPMSRAAGGRSVGVLWF